MLPPGVERRIAAGLDPKVHSVASMFISRWDKAVLGKVPEDFRIDGALPSQNEPNKHTAECSLLNWRPSFSAMAPLRSWHPGNICTTASSRRTPRAQLPAEIL
jgi:hypothetical protein